MLRSVLRRLWVRVAAFALLAILAAIAAPALSRFVPDGWADALGGNAVDQVLGILSTSMLAVTTFSLSIAVNAYIAASSTATPRAIALLQEDHTTQTTLATFLGAFVYSIVAIIGLNASYYDDGGRVVLFGATILVIVVVVLALLRWIAYLPDFGRMENTLDRVEDAARHALATRLKAPYLQGVPSDGVIPDGAQPITGGRTGYIQHIDMRELQDLAEKADLRLWLGAVPGDFVHPKQPLVFVLGDAPSAQLCEALCEAFTIDRTRDFDQDPRFGMVVFAEIASRALSPGVNDPGTAIAVIGRQVAVLSEWQVREGPDVAFDRVHVQSIDPSDMLDDAFRVILRDGTGACEVLVRLILALKAVKANGPDVFDDAANAMLNDLDDAVSQAQLSDWDREQIASARS
ncbi:DUF2254 domain-containing protein [Gymnodinialimonas hymeniacidonis]|uniref:DUF2254 domain-containing protein n=1 Tax=Gymnodinialimonas hymeniacidonis TaxID=3126508 RepID=UPI0034C69FAB